MADLARIETLLPDEAKLAEIRQAIADYNAGRPGVARRHAIQFPLLVGAYGLLVAGLVYHFFANVSSDLAIYTGLGGLFVGHYVVKLADSPRRDYQLALRYRLLPVIFSFIERFSFTNGDDDGTLKILKESRLIGFAVENADDCITGIHAGTRFTMVEAELETGGKNSSTVFKGIVVRFMREHDFDGTMQARRKINAFDGFLRGLFGFDANIYQSGDPEIDQTHEFYTDNPGAASRLMFAPLVKAIDYLQGQWRDGQVLVGFRNREVFLLLPSKTNLFELPGINQDVDFSGTIMPMIKDMVTILATMDLVAKVGVTAEVT